MEFKRWWESKTIWGGILMFIALISSFFGITISPEEQATAVDLILKVIEGAVGIVGLILTIVGRYKATKRIM